MVVTKCCASGVLLLAVLISIYLSIDFQSDSFTEPPPHLRAYPITKDLIFHSKSGTVRDEIVSIDSLRLSGWLLAAVATIFRAPGVGYVVARVVLSMNGMFDPSRFAHSLPSSFRPAIVSVQHDVVSAEILAHHANLAQESATDSHKRISFKKGHSKVRKLVAMYLSGERTPLQEAKDVLSRIQRSNQGPKPLNAVLVVQEKDVLTQAEASTKRYALGKTLSPLDGVPIVIKPQFAIKGYYGPTSGMHNITDDILIEQDNPLVAKIRSAGCIIIGYTHMTELGMSTHGDNPHFGPARNPHNIDYHTGGSSSGSAAAVAAGIVPIALGSDGGGSIRIPSALCGVTGLKATYDRIESPNACSVFHPGPIASSPEDVALLYDVLATQGPKVHHHIGLPSWSALRVGIIPRWNESAISALGDISIQRAMQTLRALGVRQFHNITVPHMDMIMKSHATMIHSEFGYLSDMLWPGKLSKLTYDTQVQMFIARAVKASDYLASLHVRSYFLKYFEAVFEEVDVLLTPVTSILAPAIPDDIRPHGVSDLQQTLQLMHFVTLQNLIGLPAISVPVGKHKEDPTTHNLPLSVQFTAKHWDEHLLLAIANEVYIETPIR